MHSATRHRSRTAVKSKDFITDLEASIFGEVVYTDSIHLGLWNTLTKIESISDVPRGFGNMNPCSHTKISHTVHGNPEPVREHAWNYSNKYTRPFWIYTGQVVWLEPTSDSINEFAWNAFLKASQQVPEEMSLPNFILELGDIPQLLVKWTGRILKYISEGYLAFEFGIKPLLSDLKAMANSVNAARKRLAHLRKTNGKAITLYHRQVLATENDFSSSDRQSHDEESFSWAWDLTRSATLEVQHTSTTVTAYSAIRIRRNLSGLDAADALLSTLAAMLGAQNPLKVIWNAIPFSFLLEYFVSIKNVLNQLQLPSFGGDIEILDACHSFKYEVIDELYGWNVTCEALPKPPDWDPDDPRYPTKFVWTPVKVGQVNATRYIRRSGIPLGASVYLTDGLTDGQKAILAALAGANWRH